MCQFLLEQLSHVVVKNKKSIQSHRFKNLLKEKSIPELKNTYERPNEIMKFKKLDEQGKKKKQSKESM